MSQGTLQRREALSLQVDSAGLVRIETDSGWKRFGPHTLELLAVFHRPVSVQGALATMATRVGGGAELAEIAGEVATLHHLGVLIEEGDESADAAAVEPDDWGFAAPEAHVRMLSDRARTEKFLRAVRETVRPGMTVVDIGTGTGIFAVAAALAGARRVFALEAGAIAGRAQRLIESNVVADRVTVMRGWSTRLSLPERVDVIVSETIGDDPYEERILETLLDATQRFLKPGGIVIPRSVRLVLQPVSAPRSFVSRYDFHESDLRDWGERYAIDFSGLRQASESSGGSMIRPAPVFVNPKDAETWFRLGKPRTVTEMRFGSGMTAPGTRTDVSLDLDRPGAVNAILGWFEAEVSAGIVLSTEPGHPDTEKSNWRCPVWLLSAERSCVPGERMAVQYRYAGSRSLLSGRLSSETATS